MGVIPMLFYALVNGCALLVETIWIGFGRPDVIGWYRRAVSGPGVDTQSPAAAMSTANQDRKIKMLR
jgi:hypothetical protein